MSNSSTSLTLDPSTTSIASFSLSSSIPVITTSSDTTLSASPSPASSQLTSTEMATSASSSSSSDPPTTSSAISSSSPSSSPPSSESSSSTPSPPPPTSSSSSSSSESPPPPTSPPPSSEPPPPSSSEPPPPSSSASSTTPPPPPSTTSPDPPPPSSSSSLQVLPPLPSQPRHSLLSTFSSTVFVTTTNSLGQTTISAPSQVTALITITDTDGNVVTSTAVIANPTLGVDDRQRKTSTFFSNTGAVVGVFVLVGLAAASIFLWIFFALRRRRRTQRIEHDTAVSATLAAAGYGRSPLVDDDDDQRPQDKLEMQQRSNSGHAVPTTSSSGNLRNSRSSAGFLDSPTLEGQQFVLDSNNYQPVAQAPLPSGYAGPGNHNYSYPIPPEEPTFNPYADYVLPGATAATGGAYIATRTSSPPPPPGALQPLPPSPPPPSGSYHHAHSPSLEPLLADYYRREGNTGNVGSLGVGEEVSGTSLSSSSPPPPIVPPRNPLRGFGLSGDAAITTIAGVYDGAGAPSSVYSTESAPLTNHQAPPPPGDDDDVSVLIDEDRPVLGVTNPDLKREGSRRTSLDS